MTKQSLRTLSGPGLPSAIWGIARRGFLDYIGDQWQHHGDTFQLTLGSRTIVIAMHPDAVRHINFTNRQNYDKLSTHDVLRDFLFGQGLITSTGELWRRQRKLMNPFFKPRAVQSYAGIMLDEGDALIARWHELAHSGKVADIGDEMVRVTASIILRTMLGSESDDAVWEMKEAVEAMLAFAQGRMAGVYLPVWVPTPMNRKYRTAYNKVHRYIESLISKRRNIPEAQWPDDFLSRLMKTRDEATGKPLPENLLRDECLTMFAGGYETTARALSAAWYALACNPEVEEHLHRELDSVLGDRRPTVEDLENLPYTLQVIKETLRLYPPAPFYIREAISDDVIGDCAVSAGCGVMMSPYYTHRHPAFWKNPLHFDPERWIPEQESRLHPCAYHPFATGQRMCIGYSFSLLESQLLLAQLASHFKLRPVPDYVPQWEMQSTLGAKNGFPMQIQLR